MIWFWFVVVIGLMLASGALLALRRGFREMDADTRYYDDGVGWVIVAAVLGLLTAIAALILTATAIDRHVSKQVCSKRDEVSSAEYQWVDFHFFNYECLLVTPAGNITETPVLPIENVGQPFGGGE